MPRSLWVQWVCITVLVIGGITIHPDAVSGATWDDRRAEARRERAALKETAAEDRGVRAGHAQAVISGLLSEVEAGTVVVASEDLWQLVAGLGRLDPDAVGPLAKRLRRLEADPDESNAEGAKALSDARASITERPWELLRRSVEVGNVPLATEFMWEVLYFDPDYGPIRKALGQKRVNPELVDGLSSMPKIMGALVEDVPEIERLHPNRYWFSPFDAARLKQGLVWDEKLGWVDTRHPDRYERGGVYDLQRKRWTTLAEANDYHSRPGRDWIVQTEHLMIKGTAELEVLAQVASRLEDLYDGVFVTFPNFFADSRRVDVMRSALGLAEHKPLKVWVYATADEYHQRADAVGWSGGIFRPSNETAYFYGRPAPVMYHEFTHQILHVMTGGNRSPAWLTEGVAMYTQTVRFDLRGASFMGWPADASWSLDELFKLRGGDDWYRAMERIRRKGLRSPYGPSGSVVTFVMQLDDGLYRADFTDYLRDSYRGKAGTRELWDYMGLSERVFREKYGAWVREGQRQKR